ncbi:hypothetical protein FN846DRAFT_634426 [Sphaerosporella brunnea]|uniref:Uncharacterized protein n=1 Tax=Sphaerosporella brunnea TaxID=1250544 RepID=A0A5J5F0J9_9PEZI|nr:hypothetical protein FN846DRAFT_634426 [Sphaerosporella brunnea]
MTTLATSLSAFTDMGYSLLKLGISIGLIVLLIPALLLSLLLFAILVSPILIASLIYLNGLDNLYFFPLALELKSVIDDVLALSGDPLSVKARKCVLGKPYSDHTGS